MTAAAQEFVGPITFEALTGRAVHTELIAPGQALAHIALARAAHAIVVAPATADFMARAAHGRADDLLAACLLAADAPVLIVAAMNDRMWAHRQTAHNADHLRELGYHVLGPEIGPLAAGEGSGEGRMPEPETIFAHVGRLLDGDGLLRGRRVVVTAGPTREPIDPVRFLSNRSTGKMGVALASAAWRRGADVTLIAGPLAVAAPVGATVIPIETSAELLAAVTRSHSNRRRTRDGGCTGRLPTDRCGSAEDQEGRGPGGRRRHTDRGHPARDTRHPPSACDRGGLRTGDGSGPGRGSSQVGAQGARHDRRERRH